MKVKSDINIGDLNIHYYPVSQDRKHVKDDY